ncbi:hypothetical protein F5Y15DRAFT_334547 [Xylariaceae sp. FL0016]|nr:hypothetical protein F5Y15DRAFT_334547 [Xylariaceae sp. FL0016]
MGKQTGYDAGSNAIPLGGDAAAEGDTLPGTMSTMTVIPHRFGRDPVSPPSTVSPPESSQSSQCQSPPRVANAEPAILPSAAPQEAYLTPASMQTVFSSHTGGPHRSHQHTAQEWESRKEELRKLYIDENCPLKKVMATMRQRGFEATVRMYKSRFEKWGFSKNNSQKEVVTMLKIQRQRNALGKRTTFHRNGREVTIDAYLRRKGISQYDLAEPGIAETLPRHVRCVTPPPDALLIQPGGALSLQELVLHSVRHLSLSSSTPEDLPLATGAAIYRGDALRCAITDLQNADWFFQIGENQLGGNMCEEGFKLLHNLVRRPSVYGLVHLLLFNLEAQTRGIVKEIWRYLAAYVAMCKVEGPLAQLLQGIFKFMSTHDYNEWWHFVFACTEQLLLIQEDQTGLPEHTVARLYPIIYTPRSYRTNPTARIALQRRCDWDRLNRGRLPRGPEEMTILKGSEFLLRAVHSNSRDPRVVELAEDVLEECKKFTYNTNFFEFLALRSIALYHRADFRIGAPATDVRHVTSVHYLEEACKLTEGVWNADLGYMMGELEMLEQWHREAGDIAAAEITHRRWRAGIDSIPKDWKRGDQGILR